MRLWSIHPAYLDRQGLIALWREGLLALAVLSGKTKGYKNHPQLERFKAQTSPVEYMNMYLSHVASEMERRGYKPDRTKLGSTMVSSFIPVPAGQLQFEIEHLLRKVWQRSPEHKINLASKIQTHPMFYRVEVNEKAHWERG